MPILIIHRSREGAEGVERDRGDVCVDDVPARRAFREQILDEVQELRVGRHDSLLLCSVCCRGRESMDFILLLGGVGGGEVVGQQLLEALPCPASQEAI